MDSELALKNLILSMSELINAIDACPAKQFICPATKKPFKDSETFKMAIKRTGEAYSTLKQDWDFKLESSVPAYARCVIHDSCDSVKPAILAHE